MIYTGITPIEKMGDIWVKREDLAFWSSLEYPSGSKVRQYLDMAHRSVTHEGYPPCIVGCSANSCQQIYVASAAKQLNTKGIIYTAKRKIRTDATKYCENLGAEIVELKPAYLSYIRSQVRARAIREGKIIQWDRERAVEDTARQVVDLPEGIKRIIVPTGSGLTAAGILLGIMNKFYAPIKESDFVEIKSSELENYVPKHQSPEIVAITTSPMATKANIEKLAMKVGKMRYVHDITVIRSELPYDTPIINQLPDGTPLDPFYAAKAWQYIQPGDLFWPPGLRPISSMSVAGQGFFKSWKGPNENKV